MMALKHTDVEIMGFPAKLWGVSDDPYYGNISGNINANHALIQEAATMPENAVIIDAGANIGLTSFAFSKIAHRGHVYCIEPSKRARACLEKMVETNNIKNCTIIPYCVGANLGTVQLNETLFLAGSYISSTDNSTEPKTRCISLDYLAAEENLQRVDMIKVDVEGYELDVLQGGGKNYGQIQPAFYYGV